MCEVFRLPDMCSFRARIPKQLVVGLLCGLCLSVSACAIHPPQPTLPIREATADQLLAQLHQKESAIHTLKGLFRADLRGDGWPLSYRLNGVFWYQKPEMIRLKGFTRFGGLVFDFFLKHNRYTLSVPGERQYITGTLRDLEDNEGFAMPIRLSLMALETLLGRVVDKGDHDVKFFEEEDQYRFDVSNSSLNTLGSQVPSIRRIWVDRRNFFVNRLECFTMMGEPTVAIRAEDFRPVLNGSLLEAETFMLPFHLYAVNKQDNGEVSLSFQEIIANRPIEQSQWQ
ncbi:MAG: hypothetical protein GKS05_11450 [Nitrospirales bacterium]|nr:hypothetical protein [Nitrospirales bacterium]